MERRLESFAFKRTQARLAETLRELSGGFATRCEHGFGQHVRLTQQELADLVGASRPVVSTILNTLRDKGVLGSHPFGFHAERAQQVQGHHPRHTGQASPEACRVRAPALGAPSQVAGAMAHMDSQPNEAVVRYSVGASTRSVIREALSEHEAILDLQLRVASCPCHDSPKAVLMCPVVPHGYNRVECGD